MEFPRNMKSGVPRNYCCEFFVELDLKHVAVNELALRHFAMSYLQHLLRLIHTNKLKASLNNVSGYRIAGTATQVQYSRARRQTLQNPVNVTQNPIDIILSAKILVPLVRDVVVGVLHQ